MADARTLGASVRVQEIPHKGGGRFLLNINRQYYGDGPMGTIYGWQTTGALMGYFAATALAGLIMYVTGSYIAILALSMAYSLGGVGAIAMLDNNSHVLIPDWENELPDEARLKPAPPPPQPPPASAPAPARIRPGPGPRRFLLNINWQYYGDGPMGTIYGWQTTGALMGHFVATALAGLIMYVTGSYIAILALSMAYSLGAVWA